MPLARAALAVVASVALALSGCGGDDDGGAAGEGATTDALAGLCAARGVVDAALDAVGTAIDTGDRATIQASLRQAQAAVRGASTLDLALVDGRLPAAVDTFAASFDQLVEDAVAAQFEPAAVTDLVNALGADPASEFRVADATISSVAADRCGELDAAAPSASSSVPPDAARALVDALFAGTPYDATPQEACIVDALRTRYTDDELVALDQDALGEDEAERLGSAFEGCLAYRDLVARGLERELDAAVVACVLDALGDVTWTTAFADPVASATALDGAVDDCDGDGDTTTVPAG